MNLNLLLPDVVKLAQAASEKILEVYHRTERVEVHTKADQSPLTEADLLSNDIITQGLHKLTPEIPILSEESAEIPFAERRQWQRYWLVDPLDGTKEFVQRSGQFAVNIALIDHHQVILGVIAVPCQDVCYYAHKGAGAYKQLPDGSVQQLITKPYANGPIRVIASRLHGLEALTIFLQKLENYTVTHSGSALKSCLVTEGQADIYPRFGPTCEWDTGAGQCIIEEAGGALLTEQGQPLLYNTKESLINPNFIVVGDKHYDWMQFLK